MLENTFIPNTTSSRTSSTPSTPKMTTEILIHRYEKLKKYPNINPPNRYPKAYNESRERRHIAEYHDLIFANSINLIPNIDIGYQQNLTPEKLEQWLSNAKSYFNSINRYLHQKCDEQYKHYLEIEKQKASSINLNMENVQALPDDIIHKIHSYLLPETRIILLTTKYPSYMKSIILKLRNDELKQILSKIIEKKYYKEIYKTTEHRNCFSADLDIRFTFKNKDSFSKTTNKLLYTYMNTPAKTPELYQYFQKVALKLLQFLVYNGAYQEKPKPIKTPRKKTAKTTKTTNKNT